MWNRDDNTPRIDFFLDPDTAAKHGFTKTITKDGKIQHVSTPSYTYKQNEEDIKTLQGIIDEQADASDRAEAKKRKKAEINLEMRIELAQLLNDKPKLAGWVKDNEAAMTAMEKQLR